jgi:hypothetical protein
MVTQVLENSSNPSENPVDWEEMAAAWLMECLSRIEGGLPAWTPETFPAIHQFASCEEAAASLDRLTRLHPQMKDAILRLGRRLKERRETGALLSLLEAALTLNPLWGSDLVPLQNAIVAQGRLTDLLGLYTRTAAIHPSLPIHLLPHAHAEGLAAAWNRQLRRKEAGLPGILLNTLPKTGSMYLTELLSKSLDLPWSTTAIPDHALRDRVVRPWMAQLALGGALSQEHLPGTPETIEALRASGIDRLIVHVRDPRQTMLSCLHHFVKEFDQIVEIHAPYLPDDFNRRSLADCADFLIENYFAEQMEWICSWAQVADAGMGLQILFSVYEDSVSNPSAFLSKAIDFYGVGGLEGVTEVEVKPSESLHFRRGLKDEWRTSFTAAQQARMRAMMPDDLMTRFGWPD